MAEKITEPVHVSSEDVCIIKPEHEVFFQQCCDCGLVHRVELSPRTEDLHLKFVNIGRKFPADLEIENYIVFATSGTSTGALIKRQDAIDLAGAHDRRHSSGYRCYEGRVIAEKIAALPGVSSSDTVIRKIELFQEKYPDQRIEISVEPDGYCCVTRSDCNGNAQPIAEGATMGDVFED